MLIKLIQYLEQADKWFFKGIALFDFAVMFLVVSPWAVISKYIYDASDRDYIIKISILIAIDTILAVGYHIWKGSISLHGFEKFIGKIIAYGLSYIVVNVITGMTPGTGSIEAGVYIAFALREALSCIKWIERIRPGTLPAWFRKRLEEYDEQGKLKKPEGKPEALTVRKKENSN